MYIEEIIIDGFKSYATRTTIGKWDSKFNAITGLNGSGKSNILDSICFVLGLTNLSHVRASSLQDLVYKKGQAGITKATVTIIFNNSDKAKSVIGFEDLDHVSVTRQIVINGKNKYLVNGKQSTQQEVTNMFHSISLNINNPNFVIMQGKITQVLNMKPQQILSLVEEAAGTRLYEDRKEKALKAMEKKESKLAHNEMLIAQEILPILDDLKEKKRILLEYQASKRELEDLERLVVAHKYVKYQNDIQKNADQVEYSSDRVSHLKTKQQMLKDEIEDMAARISEVTEEKSKNGGQFFEAEEKVKEVGKALAKVKTHLSHNSHVQKEEKDSKENYLKQKEDTLQLIANAELCLQKLNSDCDSTIKENNDLASYVKETENLVQTLTTGLACSDGQANGYMEKLSMARNEVSGVASTIQQLKIKLNNIQQELKVNEPKAQKARKENHSMVAELENAEQVLSLIEQELHACKYNAEEETEIQKSYDEIKQQLNLLCGEIQRLEVNLRSFDFQFSDPVQNFDRSKVKGLVANLVSIPPNHLDKANALEVCAGGKLYQVIVEDEKTASQLITRGQLKRRVTIIPLNKITSFRVKAEKIATAQKIAPGEVDLALTLIGYDIELDNAMNYVFGNSLICTSHAVAKRVTFDRDVMMRSITLDGDVYDPSGQLTGGAKSNSAGNLLKMQELNSKRKERNELVAELKLIEQKLEYCKGQKEYFIGLQQKVKLKSHEVELLRNRMSNNPHCKIIQHVESLIIQHQNMKKDLEENTEKQENLTKKVADLERELADFDNNRDSKLQSLKNELMAAKKKMAKMEPIVGKMEQKIILAKEELAQLNSELNNLDCHIEQIDKNISKLNENEQELKKELSMLENQHESLWNALKREKKNLVGYDSELEKLNKDTISKTQLIEDCKLDIRKLELELQDSTANLKVMRDKFNNLKKDHQWVLDQEKLFGVPGGKYDFNGLDLELATKRMKKLYTLCENMAKSVDHTVLEKYERVEKKELQLQKKLETVRKDKSQIQNTLHYLDDKKLAKLKTTFEKVNSDIGLIFGDLLPGNSCKLVYVDPNDISQGIHVKVCLGGVWKNSLGELSGGQRSLIALSLILALLQFNPAPMYILDEIDAALDLSHTQNIGKLLKNRFKTSQFIIVSLKDGMFNNANVLFRTRFQDGVSVVERKEQGK